MTNEKILAPHWEDIRGYRRLGMPWETICRELSSRKVRSASGQPFKAAALRAYWAKLSAQSAPQTPAGDLQAAPGPDNATRHSLDAQGDWIARLTISYLVERLVWLHDTLQRQPPICPEVDFLHKSIETLATINSISTDTANRANKAGSLLSQLFLRANGVPAAPVQQDDLEALHLPADELALQLQRERAAFQSRLGEASSASGVTFFRR